MPDFTIGQPPDPKPSEFTIGQAPKPTLAKTQNFTIGQAPQPKTTAPKSPSSGIIGDIRQSFEDVPAEYQREVGQKGAEAWRQITRTPTRGELAAEAIPGGVIFTPQGQAVTDYLFSPITAAATSVLGRPGEQIEKAVGLTDKKGKPLYSKQYIGDVASSVIPLGGEREGAAMARAIERVRGADTVQALKSFFAPTSMSPEAARTEMAIRRGTGEGDITAERAAQRVLKGNRAVANLSVDEQRNLVNYIENRSRGVPPPASKDLQEAADAVADVGDRYRKRAEYILKPEDQPRFIQDYYSHLWKEQPAKVEDTLNTLRSRQGSSRSFKQRTIPTLAEGIQAGLTPRIENPIENTMAYARNMSRFLATHDIQNELKDLGYAKFYAPGKAPAGWRPLDGILTEKTAAYMGEPKEGAKETYVPAGSNTGEAIPVAPQAHPIKLHAPADVARVYNNFISRGFESGEGAPLWTGMRMASNAMTGLKLGLSAYHLSTMANEGIVSELARGLQEATRGRLLSGAKAIAGAPLAPVRTALRGKRMGDELLGIRTPDSLSAKVNDAFVRSGGRLRMDPFYQSHGGGTFYQAIRKGTFGREVGDLARRLYSGDMVDKAKATVEAGAKTIQLAAAPIFEMYVPAMKRGAFAANMEDWLRSNPGATQEQIDRYAIGLSDSIDNRFGELVQDNLFWKRQMKQMAQILLLSPTWDIGTIREIGGGLADVGASLKGVAKGEGISKRTAYVAALAAWVATMNAAATYLKTGKPPQGVRDLMAYRTGGTDAASGAPERAMVPGYQKDIYAFGYDFPHHILQESINKLNPALSTGTGLLQNKDYRGLPIYKPEGARDIQGEPTVFDYLMDQAMPISLGSFEKGQKRGSNISISEQALGIRAAPSYITDPGRMQQMQRKYDTKDWERRIRADRRQQEQYQP